MFLISSTDREKSPRLTQKDRQILIQNPAKVIQRFKQRRVSKLRCHSMQPKGTSLSCQKQKRRILQLASRAKKRESKKQYKKFQENIESKLPPISVQELLKRNLGLRKDLSEAQVPWKNQSNKLKSWRSTLLRKFYNLGKTSSPK